MMRFIPVLLFITAFTLNSCKKISDLNFTLLRVPLSQDFRMQLDTIGGGSPDSAFFSITKSFDLKSNMDYLTSRSKLLQVDIEKVEYQIKYVGEGSGDSLIEAKFEFKESGAANFQLLTSDSNRKLVKDLVKEMSVDVAANQKLAEIFKSNNPVVEIRCSGRMNKRPLDFIIAPVIHLSLKNKI